jgi:NADH-quinone oxidoreductase subunit F
VAEAVAAGEKAAVGIDTYLTGENHAFWRDDKELDTFFDPEADPVERPRAEMRLIPIKKRARSFAEIELPWRENVAIREAERCLRCDYRDEG